MSFTVGQKRIRLKKRYYISVLFDNVAGLEKDGVGPKSPAWK